MDKDGVYSGSGQHRAPAAEGGMFPAVRPRRLRRTAAMRRMVAATRLHPADLILPVFVREGLTEPRPVASMPGVVQHSRDSLRKAAVAAAHAGIGGIMIFGVPQRRDEIGSGADDPAGILNAAVADVIAEVGDSIVVMADLCLDEFTSHGHCGVLADDGSVDNDATLRRYAQMALAQSAAGAHVLGASGMMDGQIGHVRAALDSAGDTDTALLAYSVKYASAAYGPFREAMESTLSGDRRTYQMDPPNAVEAIRETRLDVAEGADIVMVKPALPYLDIVSAVAADVNVPVAAYQISGEYSMICAAADNGWLDREAMMVESVTAIKRAGAGLVCTYFAQDLAELLHREHG